MTLSECKPLNRIAGSGTTLLYDVTCLRHGIIAQNLNGYHAAMQNHDHNLKYHRRSLNRQLATSDYW